MRPFRCAPLLLAFFSGMVMPVFGLDVLHMKDGTVVHCEIVAITDNILTYRTTIDIGGGRTASAQPTISPGAVDFIEFGALPGEEEILGDPLATPLKAIEALWDEASKHLHRPRSNAGEIGLLYAGRLLGEAESFQWDFSLAVFDRIRERDWNPRNRQNAWKGRLQALIQLGRLDQAAAEARELAAQSEDPEMMIEARYALARADFATLRQLESDHPKWEEDETVRPERERLYHAVIDQFLWPYLFHGTEEALAARGLVAAAEAHRFAGRGVEADACLRDVLVLYPDTPSVAAARAALEALPDPPSTEPVSPDGKPTEPAHDPPQ